MTRCFIYKVENGILVKPKFIVPLFLIIILGASGLIYLKRIRERDPDLDYTQIEGEVNPETEELVEYEETEPQTEGDVGVVEEAPSQLEEGDEVPEEPDPHKKLSIDDFEFTALPTLDEYVGSITPLGWLGASTRESPDFAHPLGNERHHIFFNGDFREGIPIFAPGSGFIEWASISSYGEWGFTVVVNETLSYYLDHIGYLNSTLLDQLMELDFYVPNQIYVNREIRLHAGQVVGYTNTTHFFDWGVVDEGVVDGIADRSHYIWRRHMYGVPAYGYASDELRAQLERYYGLWHGGSGELVQQVGEPIGGSVRNDVNGTLQGIWFYDHEVDESWGQQVALFAPYFTNRSNSQIRLSIPEISIYGNWQNMALGETGNLNIRPHLVNVESGIVGYVLDGHFGVGEEGLLLVQLIDDFHLRLETFEGVFSIPENPVFRENSVILYR
jgi:hypothetical protein